jgi:hypothetical protein
MLTEVIATEKLIESLLAMIPDELPSDWPLDTEPNPSLINQLSYTKMVNEINHREPRTMTRAGAIEPFPIFSSSLGFHSGIESFRKTDCEVLGEGIILYFKMVKYFALLFLVLFLINIPSLLIYIANS